MNTTVTAKKIVKAIIEEMQDGPAWDDYDSSLDANNITLASIQKKLVTITTSILESSK